MSRFPTKSAASVPVSKPLPAEASERTRGVAAPSNKSGVFQFRAELDITEIDTRGRPGVAWTGRAVDLSRSNLSFRSRRMCYEGRELLLAVHLVDDRPVPLYGMVASSDYDGDGLYRTNVNLLPLPDSEPVKTWIAHVEHRPSM